MLNADVRVYSDPSEWMPHGACRGQSELFFAPFAERARNDPAWRYHELPTHHYPHVSLPRETAGVLLNYA